jgi:hypothetical protein
VCPLPLLLNRHLTARDIEERLLVPTFLGTTVWVLVGRHAHFFMAGCIRCLRPPSAQVLLASLSTMTWLVPLARCEFRESRSALAAPSQDWAPQKDPFSGALERRVVQRNNVQVDLPCLCPVPLAAQIASDTRIILPYLYQLAKKPTYQRDHLARRESRCNTFSTPGDHVFVIRYWISLGDHSPPVDSRL